MGTKIMFTILLILFTFCNRNENKNNSNELFFAIDTTLISSPLTFNDIGIKISVPKKWDRLDLKKIEFHSINRIFSTNTSSQDTLRVLGIFADTLYKCYLFVSEVIASKELSYLLNLFDSSLTNMNKFKNLKGEFQKNGFLITQYLLQNQELVIFRLLSKSQNNRIFQLDYIIPRMFYDEKVARAVESSIGSLVSLK
ncbi:hypothetical protein D9V84_00855 [Bacteroidetes/Chlorobi group bacterium Naka2016]|jgi:hypothetical protein|nr:MAG: hypothetical protein D9V84_00855 [Bacteroidetes/Chlorobi group bacterium Naka2016]